ncbi:uncharacterized protein LOC110882654 [Helianthus annuus]|uniref:uncharacterized protein LOC110882654 n=1 Tax=Helianthus annuus TaxID=4232 RepID=UPI000B8F8CA8|nr:uncharacterized protein LOC110882654 [Helianthus annuus]
MDSPNVLDEMSEYYLFALHAATSVLVMATSGVALMLLSIVLDPRRNTGCLILVLVSSFKKATVADKVVRTTNELQWNVLCSHPPCNEREWEQWTGLLRVLNGVKLQDGPDTWAWKSDGNSAFSVAVVRDQILRCSMLIEEEWKHWNRWVPSKVNIFSWRVVLGRIPVKEELAKRGVVLHNSVCPMCNINIETVDHLVCNCNMSKVIWWNVLAWVKLPVGTLFGAAKEVLNYIEGRKGSKVWKQVINLIFQITIWHIWKTRNAKEYRNIQVSGNMVVDDIKADSFIWLKSRSKLDKVDWGRWVDFNIQDIII